MPNAVDWVAEAAREGGQLVSVGTGTTRRRGGLGALDATECPPTFGVGAGVVQFRIAGGERALAHATEGSEDSSAEAERDMAELAPTSKDVVVGLAVSGRTPYTLE